MGAGGHPRVHHRPFHGHVAVVAARHGPVLELPVGDGVAGARADGRAQVGLREDGRVHPGLLASEVPVREAVDGRVHRPQRPLEQEQPRAVGGAKLRAEMHLVPRRVQGRRHVHAEEGVVRVEIWPVSFPPVEGLGAFHFPHGLDDAVPLVRGEVPDLPSHGQHRAALRHAFCSVVPRARKSVAHIPQHTPPTHNTHTSVVAHQPTIQPSTFLRGRRRMRV
jgi:hypothetical protein